MTSIEADLRQHGVRLTPQRRMILEAIALGDRHVTAEDLHQRVLATYPDISLSTIYRNLEKLLELRLISVTDLGRGRVSYQTLQDARHHHLICHRCGGIIEIGDDVLDSIRQYVARAYDFSVEIDHLALWGVCSACRTAQAASTSSASSAKHLTR
jgi:Fur family ferric uptake transcriptional regulator